MGTQLWHIWKRECPIPTSDSKTVNSTPVSVVLDYFYMLTFFHSIPKAALNSDEDTFINLSDPENYGLCSNIPLFSVIFTYGCLAIIAPKINELACSHVGFSYINLGLNCSTLSKVKMEHTRAHAHIHTHTHTLIHTRTHTHTHIYIYIYIIYLLATIIRV